MKGGLSDREISGHAPVAGEPFPHQLLLVGSERRAGQPMPGEEGFNFLVQTEPRPLRERVVLGPKTLTTNRRSSSSKSESEAQPNAVCVPAASHRSCAEPLLREQNARAVAERCLQ